MCEFSVSVTFPEWQPSIWEESHVFLALHVLESYSKMPSLERTRIFRLNFTGDWEVGFILAQGILGHFASGSAWEMDTVGAIGEWEVLTLAHWDVQTRRSPSNEVLCSWWAHPPWKAANHLSCGSLWNRGPDLCLTSKRCLTNAGVCCQVH
jgi:hypothetical protein